MGRTRTRDKHLPQRLYLERGIYWFRPKVGKPVHCGHDLTSAISKYAGLVGGDWSGRTIGDVIDRYTVEVLPLKRSAATRKDQAAQLARLKKYCGHIAPDALTAQHAYRYLDGRRTKDGELAPVAARHEIVLLGHVLSKAIRWGVSSINVVRGLDYGPRSPKRAQVPLTAVEAVKLLANERIRLAIDFAVCTGQRREDLLKCRLEDCTDEGIVFRQGKTGAALLIEWSDDLRAIVERAKRMTPQIPREFVLRSRLGHRYSARGFSAIWQRLIGRYVEAGGVRFTFHDLRSVSADGAATPEEARDRLGHADVATTQRHYLRGLRRAKPRS